MSQVIAALASIKEIVNLVKSFIEMFKKLKEHNRVRKQQDALKDLENARKEGNSAAIADALSRL